MSTQLVGGESDDGRYPANNHSPPYVPWKSSHIPEEPTNFGLQLDSITTSITNDARFEEGRTLVLGDV